MEIDTNYTNLYSNRQNVHAYPNEFAIRTFLGKYPNLPNALKNTRSFKNKHILDLGCGDGRNMPLFHNCGMKIFGTEVTEAACSHVMDRMLRLNIHCEVKVGRSNQIPYPESMFDFVFASGVMSFVDEGDSFSDNLVEPLRVLKDDGLFIFYLVNATASQIINSKQLQNGYFRIENDPFNRINGSLLRAFADRTEIEKELYNHLNILSLGTSDVNVYDFFSINTWWLVCSKST